MDIKYGAISADSHAGFHRDDFAFRMSAAKWGDRVPRIVAGEQADGWSIYGGPPRTQVANCPALMGEPFQTYPTRWDEVPKKAYDPGERLKALDTDRVDAEVLFPNPPGGTFYQFGDPEFELDAVRAYNDILSDWVRVSERY